MELISSDTNIWIDFSCADFLYGPFSMSEKYQFIISAYTLEKELVYPADLGHRLLELGLQPVEVQRDEISLADVYEKYSMLSLYDRFALAIAKHRRIILLTGDADLRKAAMKEGVEVHGSLWVVDEAYEGNKITLQTYKDVLESFLSSPRIRLPRGEIIKRLARLQA